MAKYLTLGGARRRAPAPPPPPPPAVVAVPGIVYEVDGDYSEIDPDAVLAVYAMAYAPSHLSLPAKYGYVPPPITYEVNHDSD